MLWVEVARPEWLAVSLLRAEAVTKRYGARVVLDAIDLDVDASDALLVRGRSGSGKSTLLHILAGMDRPTSGHVQWDGRRIDELPEDELAAQRLANVGYVFQDYNLIPDLTAEENVRLPMTLAGTKGRRERSLALLERVGMGEHARSFPTSLSGGEMQRVAIARALANEPRLILADEPTANLDEENARLVLRMLAELSGDGRAVVVASHDPLAREAFKRQVGLREGRVATSRGLDA